MDSSFPVRLPTGYVPDAFESAVSYHTVLKDMSSPEGIWAMDSKVYFDEFYNFNKERKYQCLSLALSMLSPIFEDSEVQAKHHFTLALHMVSHSKLLKRRNDEFSSKKAMVVSKGERSCKLKRLLSVGKNSTTSHKYDMPVTHIAQQPNPVGNVMFNLLGKEVPNLSSLFLKLKQTDRQRKMVVVPGAEERSKKFLDAFINEKREMLIHVIDIFCEMVMDGEDCDLISELRKVGSSLRQMTGSEESEERKEGQQGDISQSSFVKLFPNFLCSSNIALFPAA